MADEPEIIGVNDPRYKGLSLDEKIRHAQKSLEDLKRLEAESAALKAKETAPPVPPKPKPLTRAEKEHAAIFEDEPYRASPSEINNMTMEQYARWRELGGHQGPEPESPGEMAQRAKAEADAKAEAELLENADDETYRKIRQEQDAVWRESSHEVNPK